LKSALGIVVPTLGGRPDFLNSALESIHRAANVNVCVVVPEHLLDRLTSRDLVDVIVSDPGKGLAAAINAGINALPPSVEYVNWLGDDDLLIGTGIQDLEAGLCHNKHAVLAYGHCRYVSMSGATLFDIRAGRWAEKILRFGPQLLS
jgi:hypothetical protein